MLCNKKLNSLIVKKIIILVALSTLFLTSCSTSNSSIGGNCNSIYDTITENSSGEMLWCEYEKNVTLHNKWVPIDKVNLTNYIAKREEYFEYIRGCDEVLLEIINMDQIDAVLLLQQKGYSYTYESVDGLPSDVRFKGAHIHIVLVNGIVQGSSFGCDF
jgi:hypothetical protein